MRGRAVMLALLLPLLLGSACVYKTTSRGRGLHGSVTLPFMDNRTGRPDLEITATEALTAAIERDGNLTVGGRDDTDFLIDGAVTRYTEAPFSISSSGRSEEYKLTITVVLSFSDRRTGEDRFRDQSFTGSDNFFLEGSGAGADLTRERAEEKAFEQIVESVLNAIFGEW